MYLRKNSTICYELLGITRSNLRAFYELLTDCNEYITECYYSSKLLRVSYDLFPCYYELITSIYESLRFFAKNYINRDLYNAATAIAVAAPSSEASLLEIEEIKQLNFGPLIIKRI